jgi:hypothetical protein
MDQALFGRVTSPAAVKVGSKWNLGMQKTVFWPCLYDLLVVLVGSWQLQPRVCPGVSLDNGCVH